MKKIMVAFLFSMSQVVLGARFISTIHSIDVGKFTEFHLVRFDNGRVGFVGPTDVTLLTSLVSSKEKKETVEVEVDDDHNVVAAQTVSVPDHENAGSESRAGPTDPYRPSVLSNYNRALGIFRKMRRDYSINGECYNRAHIWAYEEFNRSELNSMKIFMFFTERYIRRYKFHWWFHVTPMFYVGNLRSPRTMDRRYTSGPLQTKTWSDVFIKSKTTCRMVEKYDDFWLNQQRADCYHIYASMYYVIPRDLEKRDLTGLEKTEFSEREIRRAYQNGFNQYD